MKNTELLDTQLSAKGTDNKNSSIEEILIQSEEIEGTPFVKRTDNGGVSYYITMGDYRLTDEMDETEILETTVKDWKFLVTVISVVAEQVVKNINKNNNG